MELLTVAEAAEILKVPRHSVYRLVREVLPPGVVVRIGRAIRIRRDKLEKWIEAGGSVTHRPIYADWIRPTGRAITSPPERDENPPPYEI